jgi:ATP-dependent Clp protease ATP-binding subunit ClpA
VLSNELEHCLTDAFLQSRKTGYAHSTIGHLLLAILRVLQRAVYSAKASGKQEVGVADVLVAIFSEMQSHAAHLLNRHNIRRPNLVNYLSQVR